MLGFLELAEVEYLNFNNFPFFVLAKNKAVLLIGFGFNSGCKLD
jgi:hypothetical protein